MEMLLVWAVKALISQLFEVVQGNDTLDETQGRLGTAGTKARLWVRIQATRLKMQPEGVEGGSVHVQRTTQGEPCDRYERESNCYSFELDAELRSGAMETKALSVKVKARMIPLTQGMGDMNWKTTMVVLEVSDSSLSLEREEVLRESVGRCGRKGMKMEIAKASHDSLVRQKVVAIDGKRKGQPEVTSIQVWPPHGGDSGWAARYIASADADVRRKGQRVVGFYSCAETEMIIYKAKDT